jgi:hypothetical protein
MSETILKLDLTDLKLVQNFRAELFRDIPKDIC